MSSSDPIINDDTGPGLTSGSLLSDPRPLHHQPHPQEENRSTVQETTSSLDGLRATAAQGDGGLKTPTSSPHRIPKTRPCPHAPKKPTSHCQKMGLKRKNFPGDVRSNRDRRIPVLLDLTKELEAMFPPDVLRANFTSKIKKARRF